MPKLDKKLAKRVEKTEPTHGFGLITPGKYFGTLKDVKIESDKNDSVVWVFVFADLFSVESSEPAAGQQWYRITLPNDNVPDGHDAKKWATAQDINAGRLAALFEAFGYTPDSDTDELLGEKAVITIGVRTIDKGARTGEKVNNVNDIEAIDEDVHGEAPEAEGKDDGDEY